MKKRLISMLLVICMVFSLLPAQVFAAGTGNQPETGSVNPFVDVHTGDWYYDAVQYVRQNGIFNGTSNTTFTPNGTMTRGMFVTVLGRMAGVKAENYSGTSAFSDVPASAYYAPFVAWAAKYGVTTGTGGGKFSPDESINRQQMATFFARYLDLFEVDASTGANVTTVPADLETADSWARDSIMALWKEGLLNGDGKNFNPLSSASRAEAAALCMRLDGAVKVWYSEPGVPSERVPVDPEAPVDPVKPTDPDTGGTTTTYYEVKFELADEDKNAEGVELPETKTYARGTEITALPTPFKQDGIFMGWYYDSDKTQPVESGDTVTRNMTLYADMAESTVNLAEDETPNYITTEVAGEDIGSFVLKVTGLTNYADLTITHVSANNEPIYFKSISSDGTVTGLYKKDKADNEIPFVWEPGQTYKAELAEESTARFDYKGEQPLSIRVFNIITGKAPVDNLTVDSEKVKFIPKTSVSNISEAMEGLFSVSLVQDETGQTQPVQQVDQTGEFTYTGNETLEVGDTVAIYSGTAPNARTETTANESVVYVEVTGVSDHTYTYRTADAEDVLFTPDILPVSTAEGVDQNENDGSVLTTKASTFDYTADKFAEMGLDSTTTVDVGDFIAFYTTLEAETGTPDYQIITAVSFDEESGIYTITYEKADEADVLAAMDVYTERNEEIELTDEEAAAIEDDMMTQAIESGFADEAAEYLAALALETDGFQELSGDMDLQSYNVTFVDGAPVGADDMELMGSGKASITKKEIVPKVAAGKCLQHFKENGESLYGVRAELSMTIEITVDIGGGNKIIITVQAIFEQEVLLSINVSGGAVWKWKWIFPYIYDYRMNANIDLGTYTGIGITATAKTQGKEDDDAFDWKPTTSIGAEQKIIDIGKQITELMEKKESFLNEDVEWAGTVGGGLAEKYANMIEEADTAWFDLFRTEIFAKEGPVDKLHILVYGISADFVVSANMYVTMGLTFEYAVAKRYNFCLELFHKRSTNETIDLEESHYEFAFYVMGTAGIRAGVEFEVAIGLFSLKLDSIGITAEAGAYAQLWGYFYYSLKWSESEGKTSSYSGAMHIEIGMYLEITFKAQLFSSDKLTYEPTLYENQWPLLTIGERENVFGFIEVPDQELNYELQCVNTLSLPSSLFTMQYMDMQTGEIGDGSEDAPGRNCDDDSESHFTITLSDTEHFSYDALNNTVTITPGNRTDISAEMTILWNDGVLAFSSRPIQRTVKIHWTNPANIRYISFDSMGGSAVGLITAGTGEAITWPAENPKRVGYNFAGWYTERNGGGTKFEPTTVMPEFTPPKSGVTLYAKWEPAPNKYVIETYVQALNGAFDVVNTEVVTTHRDGKPVLTGDVIDLASFYDTPPEGFTSNPPPPDPDCKVAADGSTVLGVTYRRTAHQLTFSYGDAYKQDNPDVIYKNTKYGANIYAPTLNLGGYQFVKWVDEDGAEIDFTETYTNADGVECPVHTMPAGDTTYTAVWSPNDDTPYRVEIYIQDTENPENYYYDSAAAGAGRTGAAVELETLTNPDNCTLAKTTVGGKEITSNPTIAPDGSLVIKRYFNRSKCALTYALDGGVIADGYTDYTPAGETPSGKQVILPASDKITRSGYAFTAWKVTDAQTGTELPVANNRFTMPPHAVTVTAQWTAESSTVTLDANGGTAGTTATVNAVYDGEMPALTDLPSRAGYTFAGYFDTAEAEGGTQYYNADGTNANKWDKTGKNVTLYARWTANGYTVKFEANGGTGTMTDQPFTYDVPGNLNTNTFDKTGYTFAGWSMDGSETVYTDGQEVTNLTATADGTVILRAQWTANMDTAYTVKHYLENLDGTYPDEATDTGHLTGVTGASVTPAVKTYTGFTAPAAQTVTIAADGTTLVEYRYSRNSYPVTYAYTGVVPNGAAAVPAQASVRYGESVTVAAAPTLAGYHFSGWSASNVTGATFEMPAEAVAFTGQWTAKGDVQYKVEHYLEDLTAGQFTLDATLTETYDDGTTGANVTATAKTDIIGFAYSDSDSAETKTETIAGDGSTVLKLYYTRNSYTLSWYGADSQTPLKTESVKYGAALPAYTGSTPVKTGHTFKDWGTAPDTMPAVDTDLTATWTADQYTVNFNANGGAVTPASKQVTYGQTYGELPVPTHNDNRYSFVGWYTESSGGSRIEAGTTVGITAAQTLYAQWSQDKFTLTVTSADATMGTVTGGGDYGKDATATLTATPDTGYHFTGWTGAATSLDNPITVSVTEDATYTATFAVNTYTVKFDGNGADTGSMGDMTFTYGAAQALTGNSFSKAGYDFAGWATSANGNVVYNDGASVENLTAENGGTVTLYAQWTPVQYTITFDEAGGSDVTDITAAYGTSISGPADSIRDGYTFDGWYDGDNKLDSFPATMPLNGLSLTAHWTAVTYTIACKDQDGTTLDTKEYTIESASFTLTNPTKAGYTFVGWSGTELQGNVKDVTINKGSTGNREYTANWTANSNPVTVNDSYADNSGAGSHAFGSTVTIDAGAKTGYTFGGWTVGSGNVALANPNAAQTTFTMPDGSVTVTATWTANTYTVTFNANGGTGDTAAMNMTYGVSRNLTANGFTKAGHTFTGWNTAADGTGTSYSAGESVSNLTAVNNGEVTLYAQWSANSNTLTVMNGGTGSTTSGAYPFGAPVALDPGTKTGYTFDGWTVTDDVVTVENHQFIMPDRSVTVTANWTANNYTVTFNANGGSGSMDNQAFTYDTAQSLSANTFTAPNGYDFDGWATSASASKQYDDQATVSNLTDATDGTVTLYAKWKLHEYTITYDLAGGSITGEHTSYTVEDSFTLPQPEREGFTFAGWTGSNGDTPEPNVTVTKGTSGNLSYTANWTRSAILVYNKDPNHSGQVLQTLTASDGALSASLAPEGSGRATVYGGAQYIITGWYTKDSNGNFVKTNYADGATYDQINEAVLYADTLWTVKASNGETAILVDSTEKLLYLASQADVSTAYTAVTGVIPGLNKLLLVFSGGTMEVADWNKSLAFINNCGMELQAPVTIRVTGSMSAPIINSISGLTHLKGLTVELDSGVTANLTSTSSGVIAGANHGIIEDCHVSGGAINSSGDAGGIVGLNYGTIKGCTVSDTSVTGAGTRAGGIAGYMINGATILDCTVTNTPISGKNAGGIVAEAFELSGYTEGEQIIAGCTVTGSDVTATSGRAGGIVGLIRSSAEEGIDMQVWQSVINCQYSNGTVTGKTSVGGIVGENQSYSLSATSGDIKTTYYSASLIDGCTTGENVVVQGTLTILGQVATGSAAGGIVGYNQIRGLVKNCKNNAMVQNAETTGAIYGKNDEPEAEGGHGNVDNSTVTP